jgi:asparagine synthetase B (glutamine-hydrolysing)
VTFLRDDVLVKVDRATMFYGLEARSPLLDHRIVEFGLSLPLEYKLQGRKTKRILRDALDRRVPTGVAALQKRGFGAPLPEDLPDGPSLGVRWNRFVEIAWMGHHLGSSAVDSLATGRWTAAALG